MFLKLHKEWEEGRIRRSAWQAIAGFGIWTVVLIIILVAVNTAEDFADPQVRKIATAIVSALLLISIIGLMFGIHKARKFGVICLDLITNPGVLGGWFLARVETRYRLGANDTITATLRNMLVHPREERSSRRETVWRQQIAVDSSKFETGEDGRTTIPVAFYIPIDCHETEREPVRDMSYYRWELDIRFNVPGIDQRLDFPVPVFHTSESSEVVPEEAQRLYGLSAKPLGEYEERSRIQIAGGSGEEIRLTIPPDRKHAIARIFLGISLFMMAAIFWCLYQMHIATAILLSVLFLPFIVPTAIIWLGRRSAVINRDGVTLSLQLPGYTRNTNFPLAQIEGLAYDGGSVYLALKQENLEPGAIRWAHKERKDIAMNLEKGEARWLHREIVERAGDWLCDAGFGSNDAAKNNE